MKRSLGVIILICSMALLAAANVIELTTDTPQIKSANGYSIVELKGAQLWRGDSRHCPGLFQHPPALGREATISR